MNNTQHLINIYYVAHSFKSSTCVDSMDTHNGMREILLLYLTICLGQSPRNRNLRSKKLIHFITQFVLSDCTVEYWTDLCFLQDYVKVSIYSTCTNNGFYYFLITENIYVWQVRSFISFWGGRYAVLHIYITRRGSENKNALFIILLVCSLAVGAIIVLYFLIH